MYSICKICQEKDGFLPLFSKYEQIIRTGRKKRWDKVMRFNFCKVCSHFIVQKDRSRIPANFVLLKQQPQTRPCSGRPVTCAQFLFGSMYSNDSYWTQCTSCFYLCTVDAPIYNSCTVVLGKTWLFLIY